MREKCGTTSVVEGGEPVPKGVVVLGQLGLPGLVPLGDRLGRGAVLQVSRLGWEEHMPHRNIQASTWRAVLEGIEAELVQQCRQGDVHIVRHRVPQRQRAVGRQFTHEPLRQRLDGVVAVVVRASPPMVMTVRCPAGVAGAVPSDAPVSPSATSSLPDWHRVCPPAGRSRDRRQGVRRYRYRRTPRRTRCRPARSEPAGSRRRQAPVLDLAQPRIDLVAQLVGGFVLGFELGLLGGQRVEGRPARRA